MIAALTPSPANPAKYDGVDGDAVDPRSPRDNPFFRPNPAGDGVTAGLPGPGFMDYTDDAVVRGPGLMESDGIGWNRSGDPREVDAGKNEVAVESLATSLDRLEAGAQRIIAILIGQ